MGNHRDELQRTIDLAIGEQGLMLTLLDIRSTVAQVRNLIHPKDDFVPLWNEVCRYLDQAIDGPAKEIADMVIREEIKNERNN